MAHAAFLQLLACKELPCDGVGAHWIRQVSWKYCKLTNQAAQAEHQLSTISTVYTSLLTCGQHWQRWPCSLHPKFNATGCTCQTAGDLTISNYIILNTIKLHSRSIWPHEAHPSVLNLLSIVDSTLSKLQLKSWTHSPSLNTLNTSQTESHIHHHHHHLLCRGRRHTLFLALHRVITMPSHWNTMLRVAFIPTYKTIPTTLLRHFKSKNLSNVGSRRRVWRCNVTTCWSKKAPLCFFQGLKTGMASRSS